MRSIVTDVQLMRESGEVHADSTDIGTFDHFGQGSSSVVIYINK